MALQLAAPTETPQLDAVIRALTAVIADDAPFDATSLDKATLSGVLHALAIGKFAEYRAYVAAIEAELQLSFDFPHVRCSRHASGTFIITSRRNGRPWGTRVMFHDDPAEPIDRHPLTPVLRSRHAG